MAEEGTWSGIGTNHVLRFEQRDELTMHEFQACLMSDRWLRFDRRLICLIMSGSRYCLHLTLQCSARLVWSCTVELLTATQYFTRCTVETVLPPLNIVSFTVRPSSRANNNIASVTTKLALSWSPRRELCLQARWRHSLKARAALSRLFDLSVIYLMYKSFDPHDVA